MGPGRGRAYAQPGRYGQAQYGRGLVQLTWDRNYEWADRTLGLKGALLRNFDLALRPDLAVAILVKGMEQGAFTGLALADCITGTGTHAQFVKARRIINGTDRAEDIATHADAIAAALGEGLGLMPGVPTRARQRAGRLPHRDRRLCLWRPCRHRAGTGRAKGARRCPRNPAPAGTGPHRHFGAGPSGPRICPPDHRQGHLS
jgi:hypothetical protein